MLLKSTSELTLEKAIFHWQCAASSVQIKIVFLNPLARLAVFQIEEFEVK